MKHIVRMLLVLATIFAVVAPASAASADMYYGLGRVCESSQARRCAWINLDTTNHRLRAGAPCTPLPSASNVC